MMIIMTIKIKNKIENSNITDLLLAIDEGVIRFKNGKK